jgi:selenium metabolism protein YedF
MQTAIFIRSDGIGHGDDELSKNLMMNFLHHLSVNVTSPDVIILMNSGVKLVSGDSEVLESFRDLEKKGVEILACGACLDFFHLREKQRSGKASNMVEITNILLSAAKVITI